MGCFPALPQEKFEQKLGFCLSQFSHELKGSILVRGTRGKNLDSPSKLELTEKGMQILYTNKVPTDRQ